MKKVVRILVVIILGMITISSYAQLTALQKSQLRELDRQISDTRISLGRISADLSGVNYSAGDVKTKKQRIMSLRYEIDTLTRSMPVTAEGKRLKKENLKSMSLELNNLIKSMKEYDRTSWMIVKKDTLAAQLSRYETQRNKIFETYTKEARAENLSACEAKRQKRAIEVGHEKLGLTVDERQAEASFKKMANSPVKADSINGYEGEVINLTSHARVQFIIRSLDAKGNISNVEVASILTNPGDRRKVFLLPGKYVCTTKRTNYNDEVHYFSVSSRMYDVLGENFHFGVWREDPNSF